MRSHVFFSFPLITAQRYEIQNRLSVEDRLNYTSLRMIAIRALFPPFKSSNTGRKWTREATRKTQDGRAVICYYCLGT